MNLQQIRLRREGDSVCLVGPGRTAATSTHWDRGSPLQSFQSGPEERECGALSPPWSSHSTGATPRRRGQTGAGGAEETDLRSNVHRTIQRLQVLEHGGLGARRAGCKWERSRDSELTRGLNYSQSLDLRPKLGQTQPACVIGAGQEVQDRCLHGDSRPEEYLKL